MAEPHTIKEWQEQHWGTMEDRVAILKYERDMALEMATADRRELLQWYAIATMRKQDIDLLRDAVERAVFLVDVLIGGKKILVPQDAKKLFEDVLKRTDR